MTLQCNDDVYINGGVSTFCCSEVKTYNASMDSTLPSVPKKRKFEEVDESADSTPKKIKTEPKEEGKKIIHRFSCNFQGAFAWS